MSPDTPERLSQISTRWSLIFQAHGKDQPKASRARLELMQRYCGTIYHYLMGALHDPHPVEELCQEFALRFARGDFRNLQPEKGRFRDYVKTTLFNLVSDHRERRRKEARLVPFDSAILAAVESDSPRAEEEFINRWKEELLDCAWKELEAHQARTGQPFYEVLRFRIANPQTRSPEMAERLAAQLGQPMTSTGVRQLLHRAREKFAELLYAETARSLETDDAERIEEELNDLDLLRYCRPLLRKGDDTRRDR